MLPNGTASPNGGTIGAVGFSPGYNAVSDDGSRIFWSSAGSRPERGLRAPRRHLDRPGVSASQRTTPDPERRRSRRAIQYATPDGHFVFFTSGEKLTDNSQAEPGRPGPLPLRRRDRRPGRPDHRRSRRRRLPGRARRQRQRQPRLLRGDRRAGAGSDRRRVRTSTCSRRRRRRRSSPRSTRQLPGDADNWATTGDSKTGRVTPSGATLLFSSRAPAARLRQRRVPGVLRLRPRRG